jgi:hypothetical protein
MPRPADPAAPFAAAGAPRAPRAGALLSLFALLVGCPEPVRTNDPGAGGGAGMGAPPTGGPATPAGGPPVDGATPPSGAGTPSGDAPQAGTFGSLVPDAELEPRFAQADIVDGVTIAGTAACADCAGKLLVRVLPPPPESPGSTEPIHLVTALSLDAAGPFTLKVPRTYEKVVLQVVDDADGDGKPSAGERMGLSLDGPTALGADVSGVTLTVGVFPEMPAMDPGAAASGAAVPSPGDVPTPGGGPPSGAGATPGSPALEATPMGGTPSGGAPTGGAPAGGAPVGAIPDGAPPQ